MARVLVVPKLIAAVLAGVLLRQVSQAFVGERPAARSPSRARSGIALHAEEGGISTSDRVQLKVSTPEGLGMTEAVSEVVLPSASGQLGVLANHAPMMTALDIGVLRFKQGGNWKPVVVLGGFAKVENNQMSILVNDMEKVDDIDLEEAKASLETATAALEAAESKKEKLDATQSVKKAAARVQAAMFGKK